MLCLFSGQFPPILAWTWHSKSAAKKDDSQPGRTHPCLQSSHACLPHTPKTSHLWSLLSWMACIWSSSLLEQQSAPKQHVHTRQAGTASDPCTLLCHQARIHRGAWLMLFASLDIIIKYGAIPSINHKCWSCKWIVWCDTVKSKMKQK